MRNFTDYPHLKGSKNKNKNRKHTSLKIFLSGFTLYKRLDIFWTVKNAKVNCLKKKKKKNWKVDQK